MMPLDTMAHDQAFRFVPYEVAPGNPLDRVLIIGAGTGNDVAIALAQGAGHVVAIEIDPALVRIGHDRHPDRPYDDPRVTVVVDDGRAFLHRTTATYDMVLFAIPDSLATLAGGAALRLESYLFTDEALLEVRQLLAPGGAVAMYHYYLPVIVDRYGDAMARVFGTPPCVDRSEGAGPRARTVLTASVDPDSLTCDLRWAGAAPPTRETDDYPFPYLVNRGIPWSYAVALLAVAAAALLLVRSVGGPSVRRMRPYADLFWMGAAFLLLETMNVVRFALLFGTTWLVNALVFAGILISVLVAIEVAQRRRVRRTGRLYACLFLAIGVAAVVPLRTLLELDPLARFAAATVLGFTPVFLGNLIFAERFRGVGTSTVAFGTNLVGAMAGGIVEYGALIVGYRSLLLVVAAFYAAAGLLGWRRGSADGDAAARVTRQAHPSLPQAT